MVFCVNSVEGRDVSCHVILSISKQVSRRIFITQLRLISKLGCVKLTGIAECSVTPLSDRTIVRYREDMTLKLGNTEQTTDARAVATADKLNAVSTAAAHFLMMPLTSPHLVINADGTSFQTGGGQTELKAVVYDPEIQK